MVFIIDVYSRVVRGYSVSDNLRAEANKAALAIALKGRGHLEGLVHHSDRGSQYVDRSYQKMLTDRGVRVSMGLNAQDNAYAERVNGIIKNEYLIYQSISDLTQLKTAVRRAVKHYNEKRRHLSLPDKKTPLEFEQTLASIEYQDRPKVIIYADGNNNLKGASSPLEVVPRAEPKAHICPIVNSHTKRSTLFRD